MKLEFSQQIFEVYSNINFHDTPSRWNWVVLCQWRDTQMWQSFYNFVNAPKNNNNSNEYQTNCFDFKALFLIYISMLDTVLYYGWVRHFFNTKFLCSEKFSLMISSPLKTGPNIDRFYSTACMSDWRISSIIAV